MNRMKEDAFLFAFFASGVFRFAQPKSTPQMTNIMLDQSTILGRHQEAEGILLWTGKLVSRSAKRRILMRFLRCCKWKWRILSVRQSTSPSLIEVVNLHEYQRKIGKLVYLQTMTQHLCPGPRMLITKLSRGFSVTSRVQRSLVSDIKKKIDLLVGHRSWHRCSQ